MLNWSKTFQTFRSHSSVFNLEKLPNNLNFHSFFNSNRAFGGYFQWNACTYFQKICNWARYSDVKLIKNIWNFLFTLLCFYFRKQPKNLNFHNRPFDGYFQWHLRTFFQKICSWKRFNDAKSMADTSIFSIALRFFVLERNPKNLNFQSFYTTKTSFDGDFQWELCTNFQKKCSWDRYNYVKSKSLQFFWSQPPLLLLERVFYLLKRLGGGCFQWDGCVHFQMIWSGTSCINSKFISDTRRLLVTLLRFYLF